MLGYRVPSTEPTVPTHGRANEGKKSRLNLKVKLCFIVTSK